LVEGERKFLKKRSKTSNVPPPPLPLVLRDSASALLPSLWAPPGAPRLPLGPQQQGREPQGSPPAGL